MEPKYFLIVLQGQGDTSAKIVDRDTFEWLTAPAPDFDGASRAEDTSCPETVRKRLAVGKIFSTVYRPLVTCGSYENDRALLAKALIVEGKELNFAHLVEANAWFLARGLQPVGTFEGEIY